jgi:hypothetical protein
MSKHQRESKSSGYQNKSGGLNPWGTIDETSEQIANEQRASEKQRSISSLAIPIKDYVNFDYQNPRLKSQDG